MASLHGIAGDHRVVGVPAVAGLLAVADILAADGDSSSATIPTDPGDPVFSLCLSILYFTVYTVQ